jgi:hypothetical protein
VYQMVSRFLKIAAVAVIAALGTAPRAEAIPFTVNSQLTGDFRSGNPDGLVVNVTITGDTTSNVTNWLVDLDMAASHPSARLGVFAFNVSTEWFQYVTFSNFSPSSWTMTSGNNVPGSGGADFRFETNDPAGSSNNVTNSQSLSFTATLNSIFGGAQTWSEANFLNAALSTGGGIPDPGAQMGAHIQSLSTAGCTGCSDSGFASGNYTPTSSVPEPTTLLLMGLGLAAAGFGRRAKQQ